MIERLARHVGGVGQRPELCPQTQGTIRAARITDAHKGFDMARVAF